MQADCRRSDVISERCSDAMHDEVEYEDQIWFIFQLRGFMGAWSRAGRGVLLLYIRRHDVFAVRVGVRKSWTAN